MAYAAKTSRKKHEMTSGTQASICMHQQDWDIVQTRSDRSRIVSWSQSRENRAQRVLARGSDEDRVVVAIDKAWPLLLLSTVISLVAKPAANHTRSIFNTMSNTAEGPSGHGGPWGMYSDAR